MHHTDPVCAESPVAEGGDGSVTDKEPGLASGAKPLDVRLCRLRVAAEDACEEMELLDGGEGLNSGKIAFGANGLVPGKRLLLPSAAAAAAAADVLVTDVLLGLPTVPAREMVDAPVLRVFVSVAPFRFLNLHQPLITMRAFQNKLTAF